MEAAPTLSELNAALDDLWRCLDELTDSLSPAEWAKKHGKDWTMADVPYHIAYFDREIGAKAVERGLDIPESERASYRSMREIDAWNAEQLAQRPAGQTVGQSVEQMRESRERLRKAIAPYTDADLEKPVWISLAGFGERPLRSVLRAIAGHTWSEFTSLQVRLKRSGPLPRPETTHLALDTFIRMMPMGLNRDAAQGKQFAMRFRITGPGGGGWLLRVDNGACTVTEDDSSPADLTMTMSPDTFCKLWNEMQNPMGMILTRQIKVKGFSKMGTFGKLMPTPNKDMIPDTSLVTL